MKRALALTLLLNAATALAGDALRYDTASQAQDGIFDPVFQDYVETAYGYKNPKAKAVHPLADLRDAVASSTAPAASRYAPPGAAVYVTILPKPPAAPRFIKDLASVPGFTLSGERTTYSAAGRSSVFLGWATPKALELLCRSAAISSVSAGAGASARPACPSAN